MSNRVYVGNLGPHGQRDELEEEFSKFGTIKDVWVARNPPGFAFVVYYDNDDAKEAVRALDGKKMCGAVVKVELSNSEGNRDRRSHGDEDRGRRGPPPPRSPSYRDSPRGPPPPRGPPRDMRPPPDRGYPSGDRDRYRERPPPPRERYPVERPPRYEEDYPPRPSYRREPPSHAESRYGDRYESGSYGGAPQYRDRYDNEHRNGYPQRRSPPARGPPPPRVLPRRSPPRRQRSPPPHGWNGRSRSPLY